MLRNWFVKLVSMLIDFKLLSLDIIPLYLLLDSYYRHKTAIPCFHPFQFHKKNSLNLD